MSNLVLQNDYWETSGLYDIDQTLTQRVINARLLSGNIPANIVTTSGTDLNDYKTPGNYIFIEGEYTPTHIPIGGNGFLQVICPNSDFVLQIFNRIGRTDITDYYMYFRIYNTEFGWGSWYRIYNSGGIVPITNGGTGLSSAPSMLTDLSSSSAADILVASPRPGVTGTLPIGNGGTGAASAEEAAISLGLAYGAGSYSVTNASVSGFLTGTSKNASMFIMLPKFILSGALSITAMTGSIRNSDGGYIGGSNSFNLLSYLGSPSYNGQNIYVTASNSSGWGFTNNTPLCGSANISFTLS